jgi:hypothetical protein
MRAYHFVGKTLRDGRPVPKDGELLRVEPPIILCKRGLHAALDPFDALQYAPGGTLCLVEVGGQIIQGVDKLVATERTIIKRIDATGLLRQFAREQAASVLHLWDAPAVVVHYLLTGEEEYRAAALGAARLAALGAARLAARLAAWAAARAAQESAWVAAWAAREAREAAREAREARETREAREAAQEAARAAARASFNQLIKKAGL